LTVHGRPLERQAVRASLIAVMTAACIASNYLLIGFTNIKFMDLIVFVSGCAFGPALGATVGILTWLVYGTLNPYGFSLPVLVATALGESLYGVTGGLIGARGGLGEGTSASFKFAIIGFLLTFIYDLATNIVSGLTAGIPIAVALVAGIPFALAHEASNAAFFFVGARPLIDAVDRLIPKGENND
jgi:hypothetical protein